MNLQKSLVSEPLAWAICTQRCTARDCYCLPPVTSVRSPAQVCDTHCDTSTGSTVCISTETRCTLSAQLYSQIYMGYSPTPYLHDTVDYGTESITAVTLGDTRCPKVQHPACASPGKMFLGSSPDLVNGFGEHVL